MRRLKDDTDRRLIELLVANARQSTVALAKKLGLARTTVHERLERSGAIHGYTAILGLRESENLARCVVLLATLPKRQRAIVERLRTLPEIDHCLAVNGEFDLLVGIEAPLNQDLDLVIDRIAALDGVERCKALVVLSTRFDRREVTLRAA